MSRKPSKVTSSEAVSVPLIENVTLVDAPAPIAPVASEDVVADLGGEAFTTEVTEPPAPVAHAGLAAPEDFTLNSRAIEYLGMLLSQYVGATEAYTCVGACVSAIESGRQVVILRDPMRIDARDVMFDCLDKASDVGGDLVLLNVNRQLADVRLLY